MQNSKNIPGLEQLIAGSGMSYTELHALITGYICGSGDDRPDIWVPALCDLDSNSPALNELYITIEQYLADPSFGFNLPLPDDDQPIQSRATVLGAWIKGFLTGLGLSGCSLRSLDNPDIKEGLQDLSIISQLNADDVQEGEESEAELLELTEYTRSVVMFIYAEIGSQDRRGFN